MYWAAWSSDKVCRIQVAPGLLKVKGLYMIHTAANVSQRPNILSGMLIRVTAITSIGSGDTAAKRVTYERVGGQTYTSTAALLARVKIYGLRDGGLVAIPAE